MITRGEGTTVLAIRDGDDNKLFVFGEGVYVGDLPVRIPGVSNKTWRNPCIYLDSGDIIWGFQCWWGPRDLIKAKYSHATLIQVPVPEDNERWQA